MATLYDQWMGSGGDRFQKMERIKQLAAEKQKMQLTTQAKKKDDEQKKGNLLTSLIPTLGGAGGSLGGAAAGAAAGTAILPGVGTAIGGLLGALAGGAGGSALGKVGENAVVGETDLGKGVGEEALWGGITSVPVFGTGLKVAKASTKVATGLGKDSALKTIQEAGANALPRRSNDLREAAAIGLQKDPTNLVDGSKLANTGMDMQRRVANTGRVADSFTQEKSLVDTLNRNGLTGSATNMYKKLDGRLGEISGDISQRLAAVKAAVPRSDAIQSLRANAAKSLPGDATYEKELTRSLERLSKDNVGDITPTELFGFKQELGKRLSPAFDKINRGAPLNVKEEADMALWRSIDQDITKLAPEVKDLTRDQSQLINVRPALQASSNKAAGIPILGLKSQKLEQAKQAVQNRLGAKMAGAQTSMTPSLSGQSIPGAIARQSVGRLGADMQTAQPSTPDAAFAGDDELAMLEMELADSAALATPQEAFGGLSDEQLAQGMISALAAGDTKAFDNLKDLYAVMSSMRESQMSTEKPLSAEASKTVGNANTGLTSLAQLQQIIQNQGGKVSPATLVPFRDALGNAGANALGTASYDAATKNIADVITRLRTGAAITPQEEAHYLSMLPQTFDSPDVINQKLQMFNDLFSSVSTRTGTGSGLEDALANL